MLKCDIYKYSDVLSFVSVEILSLQASSNKVLSS